MNAGCLVSECYFVGAEAEKAVSVAVTQDDPESKTKQTARGFWRHTYGGGTGRSSALRTPGRTEEKKEDETHERSAVTTGDRPKADAGAKEEGEEEEEQAIPPRKLTGLGDDAYWVTNAQGGALFALKNQVFIRVGIGGLEAEDVKLQKAAAIGRQVLEKL